MSALVVRVPDFAPMNMRSEREDFDLRLPLCVATCPNNRALPLYSAFAKVL